MDFRDASVYLKGDDLAGRKEDCGCSYETMIGGVAFFIMTGVTCSGSLPRTVRALGMSTYHTNAMLYYSIPSATSRKVFKGRKVRREALPI